MKQSVKLWMDDILLTFTGRPQTNL